VIDTAGGAGVSQAEVFMTLENDPTIVEELKAKKLRFLPDQVDDVTADMPDPLQPAEIASPLAMRRSLLT
jgi:hypothetical protein